MNSPIDLESEQGKFYLDLINLCQSYKRIVFPEEIDAELTESEKVYTHFIEQILNKWGPKIDG